MVDDLVGDVEVGRRTMEEIERGRAKRGWCCLERGSRAALRRMDTDMVSRELVRRVGRGKRKEV